MSTKTSLVRDVSVRLLSALGILIGITLCIFLILIYTDKVATLPLVLIFGALGAFISLQRRLKELSEEDLKLIRNSRAFTWLAPVAGAVMAGILYLLFISGLLAGQLFPEFYLDEDVTVTAEGIARIFQIKSDEPSAYAKLLFWSFVAGFSERFVTDIIGQFATDAQE